jgi:hypothetical protein
VRSGEARVARRERGARGGDSGAGTDAVDHRPGGGSGDDRKPGDDADHHAGGAEAQAAPFVQVDQLERHHRAPAEVVQEDPGLHDPELPGQAERELLDCRRPQYVIVQRSFLL